jgi:large subunit ribosomal protein L4
MPKSNPTAQKIEKKITSRKTKIVVKTEVKSEKVETKKITSKDITIPLFDSTGKETGQIHVKNELFGQKVNVQLLTQAIRVYQEHQRQYNASVKTRGEVAGSTKKIYKQKGTGRARHGGKRAPIFVHGGIAHGPQVKDTKLSLPKKMRKGALISALSNQRNEGHTCVIEKFTTLEAKSNVIAHVFTTMNIPNNSLAIVSSGMEVYTRAMRNISGLDILRAKDLNAYDVMKHKKIIFIKESLEELASTFLK